MSNIHQKFISGLGCTKQTPWFCISMAIIGIAILIVTYGIYLVVFPVKVMEVETPIPVTEEVLMWGDPIEHKVVYCKYTDEPATVTLYLENDVRYLLSESGTVSNIPKGCDTMMAINTHIPNGLPPGEYRLITVLDYKLNPLHFVSLRFDTEYFTVVEK